ncbi:hypothetical protein AMECASPLE_038471 [Ameca splendens]|uniref:Uncharacterized protein n=1 Tax=Ameca splendens TaxID=208324 RepID=A0ABV0YKC9_9TELE
MMERNMGIGGDWYHNANWWIAGSNPRCIYLSRVIGQDTSPTLNADDAQGFWGCRMYGSPTSVSLPWASCGYNIAYHCQCVNMCTNGWLTGIKHFGVLRLDKALYKCRLFTISLTFLLSKQYLQLNP